MEFIRYDGGGVPEWGVVSESTVYPLGGHPAGAPTISDIGNPGYRAVVRDALDTGAIEGIPATDVSPLAPVPRPGKIVCVGLNYAGHAAEQDREAPDSPKLFSKAPSAVTNPGAPIVHPADVAEVDYEVELAVVVGQTAYDVDAADVPGYVAGYTVLNDVTARDAVATDGQNFRGKSYPTFAPMGPRLVTGEAFDPDDARISLRLNGIEKQCSTTATMVTDVAALFEYVSSVVTLRPGDVIATGTPAGTGVHRDPPELLQPGDVVAAEIDGVGVLENPVVAEST